MMQSSRIDFCAASHRVLCSWVSSFVWCIEFYPDDLFKRRLFAEEAAEFRRLGTR